MAEFDERCRHGGMAPPAMLRVLPESQSGPGRHKCTICAYAHGIQDRKDRWVPGRSDIVRCAHGKIAREERIRSLPESQAGSGRHKCVVCAYAQGFEYDSYTSEGINLGHSRTPAPNSLGAIYDAPLLKHEVGKKGRREFIPKKISFKVQKEIGDAGELLVLSAEKARLVEAGRNDLASDIVHVSRDLGDGAGYDILSFQVDGRERHIEVKTTVGPIDTPFFISENEIQFARAAGASYVLCRVFEFDPVARTGDYYVLSAEELLKLNFEPVSYICRVRKGK